MIGNKDPQVSSLQALQSTNELIFHAQVGLWAKLGLINFSLTSHDNAIPLCPTCHRELGLTLDPGLIIVPTHLEYFIDFELNDRNSRAGRLGVRNVPTADEYKRYVEGTGEYGTISRHITGGLYTPIFLKHYFFMGRFPDVHQALLYSRPWHGSPLAALRRAFMALGSGRIGMIPPKMKSDLQLLRDLYFYKDIAPMDPAQHPQIPGAQKRNGSPLDNTSQQPPTKIKRRDYPGEGQGDSSCFEGKDPLCDIDSVLFTLLCICTGYIFVEASQGW